MVEALNHKRCRAHTCSCRATIEQRPLRTALRFNFYTKGQEGHMVTVW